MWRMATGMDNADFEDCVRCIQFLFPNVSQTKFQSQTYFKRIFFLQMSSALQKASVSSMSSTALASSAVVQATSESSHMASKSIRFDYGRPSLFAVLVFAVLNIRLLKNCEWQGKTALFDNFSLVQALNSSLGVFGWRFLRNVTPREGNLYYFIKILRYPF